MPASWPRPCLPPRPAPAGTPAAPAISAYRGGATAGRITFAASPTASEYRIQGQRQGSSAWTSLANRTTAGTQSLPVPEADWGRWLLRVLAVNENGTPSAPAVAPDYITVGTPAAPTSLSVTGAAEGALAVTFR